MDIGIVGNGVVGQATGNAYRVVGHTVKAWDLVEERSTHPLRGVLACHVIFVCLPTPARPDGSCDVDPLLQFFTNGVTNADERRGNFVIRSTVPVGFTRTLYESYGLSNVVHSPEFLTARTAEYDAQYPRLNLVGIPAPQVTSPVVALYRERFPSVQTMLLRSDESELVKVATNAFFAVKVSYFNEVAAFCKARNLEYHRVSSAMTEEGRISPMHTLVPGPDGKPGYGGACLPKDLTSLYYQMLNAGLQGSLLEATIRYNHRLRPETV